MCLMKMGTVTLTSGKWPVVSLLAAVDPTRRGRDVSNIVSPVLHFPDVLIVCFSAVCFKVFDSDGDGFLSRSELEVMCKALVNIKQENPIGEKVSMTWSIIWVSAHMNIPQPSFSSCFFPSFRMLVVHCRKKSP